MVVGPSGTGKSTLVRRLARELNMHEALSHTTRPRRPDETDGVDYRFITPDVFQAQLAANQFVESVCYADNYYGISRSEIEPFLTNHDQDVIIIVEGHGAEQLLRTYPCESRIVYLLPPSLDILKQRLRNRGTSEELVARRLHPDHLRRELQYVKLAHYYIGAWQQPDLIYARVRQLIVNAREVDSPIPPLFLYH